MAAKQEWDYIPVVFHFADDSPMSIMHFITRGYGDTLPRGGAWTEPGIWIRPADRALIEAKAREVYADRAPIRSWRKVSKADIPEDRTYRNALTDTGTAVVYDMDKAKALHRAMLRTERAEKLLVLDAEWMRATGQKRPETEIEAIEAERQVLRDALADPRIEAATTIDELKAVKL